MIFFEGFYLNLSNEDAFDRQAHGIYKLIPYYQKIYPLDESFNQFVIQKHPFTNKFQLVKIQDWAQIYGNMYSTKSIKSMNYEESQIKDINMIVSFFFLSQPYLSIKK